MLAMGQGTASCKKSAFAKKPSYTRVNYKHLHYFWTVLRTGSIARASEQLHLTPQTLSGQIKLVEERLGKPLLRKAGRGVEPTDAGRMVQRYADEIFTLGSAMQEALTSGRDGRAQVTFRVGVADSVPKSVACHVLEPCLASPDCTETALRPRLDAWLRHCGLTPRISAEFDDAALTKAFGRRGLGVFAGPAVLADEIEGQYGAQRLGTAPTLLEEFYAISIERRITHPAVAAITHAARRELFR